MKNLFLPSQNKFLITVEKGHLLYWYEMFWFDMYKLCKELGLDEEQRAKIVSDAFIELWRAGDTVKGMANVKAFLYGTTRKLALQYLKSQIHG